MYLKQAPWRQKVYSKSFKEKRKMILYDTKACLMDFW